MARLTSDYEANRVLRLEARKRTACRRRVRLRSDVTHARPIACTASTEEEENVKKQLLRRSGAPEGLTAAPA